jgi:hypothetical protein
MTEKTLAKNLAGFRLLPAFSTQWENAMSNLSRRSALAAIGGSVAIAPIPSLASGCSFPQLASQLVAIRARYAAEYSKQQVRDRTVHAYCEKITGLTEAEAREDQCCHPDRPNDGPKWQAWWAAYMEYPDDESHDSNGHHIEWGAITGIYFPLCREILRQPTHSVADAGVQLQAWALLNVTGFTEREGDVPMESQRLAQIMAGICAVDLLPGLPIAPIKVADDECEA